MGKISALAKLFNSSKKSFSKKDEKILEKLKNLKSSQNSKISNIIRQSKTDSSSMDATLDFDINYSVILHRARIASRKRRIRRLNKSSSIKLAEL